MRRVHITPPPQDCTSQRHAALRPRGHTGTVRVKAMHRETASTSAGDGSRPTRGSDIERALLRCGLMANPSLKIYKPWLDRTFVGELGSTQEMSEWLNASGFSDWMSVRSVHSTDSNIWGATTQGEEIWVPERRGTAHRQARSPSLNQLRTKCVRRSRRKVMEHPASRRLPGRDQWPLDLPEARSIGVLEANKIGGRHGLGISDQIEPRHRSEAAAASTKAPGMALLYIAATRRLISAIHNEGTIGTTAMGRRLGRHLLYEAMV